MRPLTSLGRFFRHFIAKYIPKFGQTPDFSESREKITPPTREIKPIEVHQCPYCSGKNVVKRGLREKKYEIQQRYLCNDCQRSFVPQRVKGKSFPLKLILEGLSLYNLGYSLEEACQHLKERFGLEVKSSTLNDWVKEFTPLCRYSRLRPYGLKLFSPHQVIQATHLFHHQVYDFSVHRAKLALLLQEYKYGKFDNLREFLEAIQSECPHQFFQEGVRASEQKVDFSLDEVIIREKQNFATRIAGLALQAVSENKLRHKALQNFMLANDSVTVAVEVPVYIDQMDIEHMQEELKFRIPLKLDKVLTGHIDILQLRNGAVHILDYKPQDKDKRRIKPVTQLTLYALMLSRLTGLRLYDFKCAWFDEKSTLTSLSLVFRRKKMMYTYTKTYRKTAFRVKKPIRSFRDLEVYQRTLCCATEIMTKVVPLLSEGNLPIKEKLVDCCLKIPESIAAAHSHRFETGEELKFLEDALEGCNKAVVYLEQARDIFIKDIEGRALCDDLIKRYILVRRKIFNLYKAWKRFQKVL